MQTESLLGEAGLSSDLDRFSEAFLVPKDRHGASYLDVREEGLLVDNEDLLCFALVRHESFIVDASVYLLTA